ncbi:MAG: hypothetical protein JNK25_15425, partial [Phycisphaerae bacterium]|nr:hypothetical protein [Phycisphaerae bacterium]
MATRFMNGGRWNGAAFCGGAENRLSALDGGDVRAACGAAGLREPRGSAPVIARAAHRPRVPALRLCRGWAVLVLANAVQPALTQTQILEVHPATLTAYKPTAATGVQDVRPLNNAQQRGVNLDGTARLPSPYGWAIQGNPFEGSYGPAALGDIRLDTGTYAPLEIDLALPSAGLGWVIGRTYNARQETGSPAHRDSDGYQGRNWQQTSQPEIALFDADGNPATRGDDDVLTIVYGADRFIEFDRTAANADTFKGKNGAAGVVLFAANGTNEPETYTYHDQAGNTVTFLGFDGDAGAAAGQFWKMRDAAGNTSYVGSATLSGSTATTGYSSGRITTAYDPADRRYTYTYTSIDGVDRLTRVKAETKTGGAWASPSGVAEVGRVDYDYYQTGDNTHGDNGNLKMVTTTMPLTDSGINDARRTYYRYWKGAYHATTNPGHANTVRYVMHPEGTRAFDWTDGDLSDADFLSASESSIKPYSSHYFEYDGSYRIREVFANGECGCGGGDNGAHGFTYDAAAYANGAARRTVVARPDGTFHTVYFTGSGEVNASVITDGDPAGSPNRNVTEYIRNGDGQVTGIRTPAANTGYTHSTGTFTASSSVGLVRDFTRESSAHVKGFLSQVGFRSGTGGTLYYERGFAYADDDLSDTPEFTVRITVGGLDVYRPVRWWTHLYPA